LFAKWSSQPAAQDIPEYPEFLASERITLQSVVLGCRVTAEADNNSWSICIAEQVLSGLEGLLATCLNERVAAHVPEFKIDLVSSSSLLDGPHYEFNADGLSVKVTHPSKRPEEERREWLQRLILEIFGRIAIVDDLKLFGEKVFGEEEAMSRAFSFSETFVPLTNILGQSPKIRLSDWKPQPNAQEFNLQRNSTWNSELRRKEQPTSRLTLTELRVGGAESVPDLSISKHKDRTIFSFINLQLWDKADWGGTVYALDPYLDKPPVLALAFRDAGAGKAIFTAWRETLGEVDQDEQLRITIVRGVDKFHPSSYKVVIGSNPAFTRDEKRVQQFVSVSRINRMDPSNSRNLDGFLARFERIGRYFIVPAYLFDGLENPDVFFDLAIEKTKLIVRKAWEIGLNDLDGVAIDPNDTPLVPDGVEHVPVFDLIARKRTPIHRSPTNA
jgi:hypothetical protein